MANTNILINSNGVSYYMINPVPYSLNESDTDAGLVFFILDQALDNELDSSSGVTFI